MEFTSIKRLLSCFNPQASYEARRSARYQRTCLIRFNPQASYEARLDQPQFSVTQSGVSIHRPHTRPDEFHPAMLCNYPSFNPQASYEARHTLFRSVLPTLRFNPQASYEARHPCPCAGSAHTSVSIHRPHTRPDDACEPLPHKQFQFQSTGLIRGPTGQLGGSSDIFTGFNPQASYEARQIFAAALFTRSKVSIHRPHTRPDEVNMGLSKKDIVSIHRPHTRPDTPAGMIKK